MPDICRQAEVRGIEVQGTKKETGKTRKKAPSRRLFILPNASLHIAGR
jgi:hypothetical protein